MLLYYPVIPLKSGAGDYNDFPSHASPPPLCFPFYIVFFVMLWCGILALILTKSGPAEIRTPDLPVSKSPSEKGFTPNQRVLSAGRSNLAKLRARKCVCLRHILNFFFHERKEVRSHQRAGRTASENTYITHLEKRKTKRSCRHGHSFHEEYRVSTISGHSVLHHFFLILQSSQDAHQYQYHQASSRAHSTHGPGI